MSDDCSRLRELLDSYLSDELLVETNHAVERHLARCSACGVELERRRRVRFELGRALELHGSTDALEGRIRRDLAGEPPAARRAGRLRIALGAAAALAALAFAPWPRGGPSPAARTPAGAVAPASTPPLARPVDLALFDDTSRLHLECAIRRRLRTPPLEGAERRLQTYAAIWPAAQPELGEWTFVDAHVCPPRGVPDFHRQYGHVVLQRAGHRVSLLATVDRKGALPEGDVLFQRDGARIVEAERGGFRLSALDEGERVSFVVSDLAPDAHRAVGQRVLARLGHAAGVVP